MSLLVWYESLGSWDVYTAFKVILNNLVVNFGCEQVVIYCNKATTIDLSRLSAFLYYHLPH